MSVSAVCISSGGPQDGEDSFDDNEGDAKTVDINVVMKCVLDLLTDLNNLESKWQICQTIFDSYQEQPHLLDPHISTIMDTVLPYLKLQDQFCDVGLKILYLVSKVRGYKIIMLYLPHDVGLLEDVLKMTELSISSQLWEPRYVLLLWLAIICKNPFSVQLLNKIPVDEMSLSASGIEQRIISVAKQCLKEACKVYEAAAYLLSSFLLRPDVANKFLCSELTSTIECLSRKDFSCPTDVVGNVGLFCFLCRVFKEGERISLKTFVRPVLQCLESNGWFHDSNSTTFHKLAVKLLTRLAFVIASSSGVQQKSTRRLQKLLQNNVGAERFDEQQLENPGSGFDMSSELELIISNLLLSLRNVSTIVRWSAAKGIGKVVSLLSSVEQVEEVVTSFFDLLSPLETDSSWHGACLALAELGRRSMLMSDQLPLVVPAILKALTYDQQHGTCAVGANVRDAACYVCWSFARSFSASELAPHAHLIARTLVAVSLFDCEVNCRRAACAAFQENVGRLSACFGGLEILSFVNFYSVGNCANCYLNLAPKVAELEGFGRFLIDFLLQHKIGHWSEKIRRLAAASLNGLYVFDSTYMCETVVPLLIKSSANRIDLWKQHGSFLAVAELICVISHNLSSSLSVSLCRDVLSLPESILQSQSSSRVSEQLLFAFSRFVQNVLQTSSSCLRPTSVNLEFWRSSLDKALVSQSKDVAKEAARGIAKIIVFQCSADDSQGNCCQRYIDALVGASSELQQVGVASCFSFLPPSVLERFRVSILKALIQASVPAHKQRLSWTDARREAILCMAHICDELRSYNSDIWLQDTDLLHAVVSACIAALDDYTTDARGDIGSWVRQAGMQSLGHSMRLQLLPDDVVELTFLKVLQLCCDKIDRTRKVAIETTSVILKNYGHLKVVVTCGSKLHETFCVNHSPSNDDILALWKSPKDAYKRLAQLLSFPTLQHYLILGFLTNSGDCSESTYLCAVDALLEYFQRIHSSRSELQYALDNVATIFEKHWRTRRIATSVLKFCEQLFNSGYLELLSDDFFAIENNALSRLWRTSLNLRKSTSVQMLIVLITFWCSSLQLQPRSEKKGLLRTLLLMLLHELPRIRKHTATELYETLVVSNNIVDENIESLNVLHILSETDWTSDSSDLSSVVNDVAIQLAINDLIS